MAETSTASKPKSKSASASFELPAFEMPKFDMPKMEVPAAFRDMAEKGISQAKDTYEKMKAAAEEATDMLEDTYSSATKGFSDYGLKVIEVARANTNAAFDYANDLFTVKSVAEVIEISTTHARRQFEALTSQTKELTALAQKVAAETVEPMKEGVSKAFKKVN
jgi:phasin